MLSTVKSRKVYSVIDAWLHQSFCCLYDLQIYNLKKAWIIPPRIWKSFKYKEFGLLISKIFSKLVKILSGITLKYPDNMNAGSQSMSNRLINYSNK